MSPYQDINGEVLYKYPIWFDFVWKQLNVYEIHVILDIFLVRYQAKYYTFGITGSSSAISKKMVCSIKEHGTICTIN